MGVGCGNVGPSAGLVRSQGSAVLGCGSGLICVGALARLGGCDGCRPGFGAFGRSGARCCVRWRPSAHLVTSGRGLAWRPAAVVCWVLGLGGGAAGGGVRRVVLCGAQGPWGAVGAAGVGALTLVGWSDSVCVRGWASGDFPQADAVSLRLLEGLPQALEDIRVVLGRGEGAGVDSQGVERIGQHGFPCGLRHPPPSLAGGGSSPPTPCGADGPGPRGRALPGPTFAAPRAACGSSAATTVPGRGRGLRRRSGRGWVCRGRGDWWRWRAWGIPRSPVPWGCAGSGAASGCALAGVRAHSPPRGGVGTLCGGGSRACAVCRLTSRVGRGAGTLLADSGVVLARSGAGLWAWGVGFERWRDEVRCAFAAARSAMKVVAVASVTAGGRRAGRCCPRAWDGWG